MGGGPGGCAGPGQSLLRGRPEEAPRPGRRRGTAAFEAGAAGRGLRTPGPSPASAHRRAGGREGDWEGAGPGGAAQEPGCVCIERQLREISIMASGSLKLFFLFLLLLLLLLVLVGFVVFVGFFFSLTVQLSLK